MVDEPETTTTTKAALDALALSSPTSPLSSTPAVVTNGVSVSKTPDTTSHQDETEEERIAQLESELTRTREERDNYANQYQTLLSRIQTMRNTLGNKLKQDAEELDRREQTISTLNLQIEDLTSTISTLQSELVLTNEESERSSKELEHMRTRALEFEANSKESIVRERELREVREELEVLRLEKEDLERNVQTERVAVEEGKEIVNGLRKELESERVGRRKAEEDLGKEKERSGNLQSVLEDFQSGKEMELQRAVSDIQSQLDSVTLSLAEYKHRANQAEMQLESQSSSSSSLSKLEAENKEKSAIISKLRHQSVILNEHLTEALRRLHKNSSENNVDRRLVTNILLSFLTTPRADSKRFEMLSLLSTVLSWSDDERERAGLQRTSSLSSSSSSSTPPLKNHKRRDSTTSDTSGGAGVGAEESFSTMWVEFLLKEATQGQHNKQQQLKATSPATTPTSEHSAQYLSVGGGGGGGGMASRRVTSLGGVNKGGGGGGSTPPNLVLGPPGGKKEKEKEKEKRLL